MVLESGYEPIVEDIVKPNMGQNISLMQPLFSGAFSNYKFYSFVGSETGTITSGVKKPFMVNNDVNYENGEVAFTSAGSFESITLPCYSNITYLGGFAVYDIWEVYDECNDGTVDTTKWTTSGTVGETSGDNSYLYIDNSSYAQTNTFSLSNTKEIEFLVSLGGNIGGVGFTYNASVILTDGTNTTTLESLGSNSNASTNKKLSLIKIMFSGSTAIVFIKTKYYWSGNSETERYSTKTFTIDLTGWSNPYLKFERTDTTTNTNVRMKVFYVRQRTSSFSPSSTIQVKLSNDGGTTWNNISNYSSVVNLTANNQPKLRFEATPATGEVVVFRGYGVWW